MDSFLVAGLGVSAFITTNLDDSLILLLFFGDHRFRPHHVVAGQILGIGLLVLAGLVGGLLAQGLAGRWSGLLGLLPILIGFRELVERRQRPREREIPAIETGSDKSAGWRRALTIAVVTVANGGDNIGVYVPLFTRHSAVEITLLLIVFAVRGLWHGARWSFVVWGLLHGVYYLMWRWCGPACSRIVSAAGLDRWPQLLNAAQVALTFALVSVAWVFFRAEPFSDAWFIVTHMIGPVPAGVVAWPWIGVAGFAAVALADVILRGRTVGQALIQQPPAVRWALYYGLTFAILIFGRFGREQFIYFQF